MAVLAVMKGMRICPPPRYFSAIWERDGSVSEAEERPGLLTWITKGFWYTEGKSSSGVDMGGAAKENVSSRLGGYLGPLTLKEVAHDTCGQFKVRSNFLGT